MALGTGCKVVVVGSNTYETCGTTADCSDPLDSCVAVTTTETRSMCTRSCTTAADCPGAGRCLSFDGGSHFVCFEACVSNSQCDPGWSCTDYVGTTSVPPVCLPGVNPPPGTPPYYQCTPGSTTECTRAVQGCFTVTIDGIGRGMCSSSCRASADCPLDDAGVRGVCYSFDSGRTSACFHACRTTSDCPPGFACKNQANGASLPFWICLPTSY